MKKRIRHTLLATLLAATTIAIRPAAAASPASPDTPAQAGTGKIEYCLQGLESFFPGDYYACRAVYHLQRKHYGQFLEMLRESAYWANKNAQYELGLVYFNGDIPGIPMNRPLGLAWLALAVERKNPDFQQAYTTAYLQSSPQERAAASDLWKTMLPKYGDKVAALRAIRRYNRAIGPLHAAAESGGITYISGFTPFPQSAFSVVKSLQDRADRDFDDLQGTVTVGVLRPLDSATQQVPSGKPDTAH
jgi:hypothetical protein